MILYPSLWLPYSEIHHMNTNLSQNVFNQILNDFYDLFRILQKILLTTTGMVGLLTEGGHNYSRAILFISCVKSHIRTI